MKKIILIGGGTFSHVRSHLALAAPAFGQTVATLKKMLGEMAAVSNIASDSFRMQFENDPDGFVAEYGEPDDRFIREHYEVEMYLTKMVDAESNLVTNEDISALVDTLIADKDVRVIVFNPALVDFHGQIDDVPSGKYAERLRTDQGDRVMELTPADKIIGRIRKHRKDIFVVGFKTTNGASSDEQFVRGLELLKKNSLNLVVANDPKTRNNMIITPEETRYGEGTNRLNTLHFLSKMIFNRMRNKFTRSTVVEGAAVDWNGPEISDTLRTVVNHCIAKGAYKPFLGKTAGHFATKVSEKEIITSIRKTNFNQLSEIGMVRIKAKNDDEVIAYGFKPSVGGQSQRIIFKEHPEMDSIVHFHSKPFDHVLQEGQFTVVPQWPNECGSHSCGAASSKGLTEVNLGDGDMIKVVYLDNHGPNIVFNSHINPNKVINYIDKTFDLSSKTGGLFN